MDHYPGSVACSPFSGTNDRTASTERPQNYALTDGNLIPDYIYSSYMSDDMQSQPDAVHVDEPHRSNAGGDFQFTYSTENQVLGHPPPQTSLLAPDWSYRVVIESEPVYNVQLNNESQLDVYFCEPETVHSLPTADTLSSAITYDHSSTTVTTATTRQSPSMIRENFIRNYDHGCTNVAFLATPALGEETSAYQQIYSGVDLDPEQAMNSYEVVVGEQSWQYSHQPHHSRYHPDSQQHRSYQPHQELSISESYPSDSANQLDYVYSTQPYELSGTMPVCSATAITDPYSQTTYETFEPGYIIEPVHSETVPDDKFSVPNFTTSHLTEIVYQIIPTTADTSYVNYPVMHERNLQVYPTTHAEFERSVVLQGEQFEQGDYYYEQAPVIEVSKNVSTYNSYTMVPQFDSSTATPRNTLVWADPNFQLSAYDSTNSVQLNDPSAISWTDDKNPSDQSRPEPYGFASTNGQIGAQNTMQSEVNQYAVHQLSDYPCTGSSAVAHQSLFPQPRSYLSRSAEATTLLQPESSFLPNHEQQPIGAPSCGAGPPSALKCIHCAREFSRPSHLEIHHRVHTGVQPYSCILCGRQFNQASNLRRHLTSHKSWPPNISISRRSVPPLDHTNPSHGENQSDVENPIQLDTKPKHWVCGFCGEQLASYLRLRGHLIRHKNRQVYACVFDACSESFASPESFLAHVIEQHPDPVHTETNTCPTCGRQFRDTTENVQHCLPRRRGLPFRCGTRSLNPRRRIRLTGSNRVYHHSHRRRRHGHRATTSAVICHARSIDRRYSRRRMSRRPAAHSSSPSLLSSAAVKTQIRLLTLQRSHLTQGNQLYRCPLCSRRYRDLNRLRQHLSSSHAETLAMAVQQNTDVSVLDATRSDLPVQSPTVDRAVRAEVQPASSSDCDAPRSGATQVPLMKPTLFLLHVEQCQLRPERTDVKQTVPSHSCSSPSAESPHVNSSSALSCEFCGRTFQKPKFFHDHQMMCKQIIEERQRRQRLRLHRQMGFRDTAPLEPATHDDRSFETRPLTGTQDVSEQVPLGSCQTDDGLRRSQRAKTFRVLWTPRRLNRRKNAEQSAPDCVPVCETQTSQSFDSPPSLSTAFTVPTTCPLTPGVVVQNASS